MYIFYLTHYIYSFCFKDFSIEFYIRQRWNDPALVFSQDSLKNKKFIVLNPELIWKLWKPDTYIENLKSLGTTLNGPMTNEGLRTVQYQVRWETNLPTLPLS